MFMMKMRYGLFSAILLMAFFVQSPNASDAASTADPTDNGPVYTMELCFSNSIDTVLGQVALKFKELVEERTKGRVKMTLYPNATIASTADELITVSNGGIDAAYASGPASSSAGVHLEDLYSIPFLFSCEAGDARLMRAVDKDDAIQNIINASIAETSLNVVRLGNIGTSLGTFPFANNRREVNKPADAAGLKIRTPGGEYFALTMRAFGVDPISINVTELPIALQQGIVDGLCTNLTYYHDSMLHTRYLTMPYVTTNTVPVYVNKDWWEALPGELRDIIANDCMDAAIDFAMDTLEARELQVLELIRKEPYNVKVSTLDFTDPDMQKFSADLLQKGIDIFVERCGRAGQVAVDRVLEIRDELGMPKIN
jgi:C4-dicarboxylate-binding protein DctP